MVSNSKNYIYKKQTGSLKTLHFWPDDLLVYCPPNAPYSYLHNICVKKGPILSSFGGGTLFCLMEREPALPGNIRHRGVGPLELATRKVHLLVDGNRLDGMLRKGHLGCPARRVAVHFNLLYKKC